MDRAVRPAVQLLRSLPVCCRRPTRDGGGSIRIPAAMCGLVGLKPSRGRISMGPHMDEWGNSVQHRVHTVRDSAAILDATIVHVPGDGVIALRQDEPYADLVGRDPGRLRIGFLDHAIRTNTEIDPDVADAFVRPPPDSRRSATMSSERARSPTRRIPHHGVGSRLCRRHRGFRGGDRRRGRPRARRWRHRTLDHVHRRAGLDVPTGGRDRAQR